MDLVSHSSDSATRLTMATTNAVLEVAGQGSQFHGELAVSSAESSSCSCCAREMSVTGLE